MARHKQYTEQQIQGAVDRVRRGYTVAEASRLSGVKRDKLKRELRLRDEPNPT